MRRHRPHPRGAPRPRFSRSRRWLRPDVPTQSLVRCPRSPGMDVPGGKERWPRTAPGAGQALGKFVWNEHICFQDISGIV